MSNLMNRKSLDPRWTRHHLPSVRGFYQAVISIVRNGDPNSEYDFETGEYVNSGEAVLSQVPARVQPFGIMGNVQVAQDPTTRRLYRVQFDFGYSPLSETPHLPLENFPDGYYQIRTDDIVRIIECKNDLSLVNYQLDVRGSTSSSNAWLTDLVCEMDEKG